MQTLITDQATIDHDRKTITVCAWCYPKYTFLAKQPQFAGLAHYDFNHSICGEHMKEQRWLIAGQVGQVGPLFLDRANLGILNPTNK